MYIPNEDTQNYPFFRLRLVVEMFGQSTLWTDQSKFNKSPQRQRIRKHYFKTFRTSVINSPMSPSSPAKNSKLKIEQKMIAKLYTPKDFRNVELRHSYCRSEAGREGILDCKLHLYPKIYNHVLLFVSSKNCTYFDWLVSHL